MKSALLVVVAFLLRCGITSSANSVTVVSPTTVESLTVVAGRPLTIRWEATGDVRHVEIGYLMHRGRKFSPNIAEKVDAAAGEFVWNVPADMPSGRYWFTVRSHGLPTMVEGAFPLAGSFIVTGSVKARLQGTLRLECAPGLVMSDFNATDVHMQPQADAETADLVLNLLQEDCTDTTECAVDLTKLAKLHALPADTLIEVLFRCTEWMGCPAPSRQEDSLCHCTEETACHGSKCAHDADPTSTTAFSLTQCPECTCVPTNCPANSTYTLGWCVCASSFAASCPASRTTSRKIPGTTTSYDLFMFPLSSEDCTCVPDNIQPLLCRLQPEAVRLPIGYAGIDLETCVQRSGCFELTSSGTSTRCFVAIFGPAVSWLTTIAVFAALWFCCRRRQQPLRIPVERPVQQQLLQQQQHQSFVPAAQAALVTPAQQHQPSPQDLQQVAAFLATEMPQLLALERDETAGLANPTINPLLACQSCRGRGARIGLGCGHRVCTTCLRHSLLQAQHWNSPTMSCLCCTAAITRCQQLPQQNE